MIATSNVKHFPRASCEPYGIDVQRPDDFFLRHQYDVRDPEYPMGVLEHCAAQLRTPPLTVEQLVGEHLARSAPKFGRKVLRFARSRA